MYKLKPLTFDWIRRSRQNGNVLQLQSRSAPRPSEEEEEVAQSNSVILPMIIADAAVGSGGACECEDRRDGTQPLDEGEGQCGCQRVARLT